MYRENREPLTVAESKYLDAHRTPREANYRLYGPFAVLPYVTKKERALADAIRARVGYRTYFRGPRRSTKEAGYNKPEALKATATAVALY